MTEAQAKFEGWAVVEMMGHQREVGYVTTEVFGAACLFRVDTPELPERDYELKRPEWAQKNGEVVHAPAGSKVRRPAVPAKTRLIGPPAIYAITPCTEQFARTAIEELIRREPILLSLPENSKALPAAALSPFQPADAFGDERVCEECGQTPEDGHAESCSFADDEDEQL